MDGQTSTPWHTLPWPCSYRQVGISSYLKMPQNKTQASPKLCNWICQFYNFTVPFETHITRTPNESHRIPSCLTHPVQHVKYHFRLLPALTFPHIILFKKSNQNLPWHISHTLQYRHFYSRGLLAYIWKLASSLSRSISTTLQYSTQWLFQEKSYLLSDLHIVKRGSLWMTSLCKYLGSLYCPICFALFQASSLP